MGVVGMFGLVGIVVFAGLTELIIQSLIRNRKTINIIGLVIVVGLMIAIQLDA